MGLDPRPFVELPLQPLGADGPVRQSMRRQHRKRQTARATEVTLNPLQQRLLRIIIAPVASVAVHHPRTTAGTGRTQSFELIFANLDRRTSPKSSRPIKPLYLGHHVSTPTILCLPVQSHAPPSIHTATIGTAMKQHEFSDVGKPSPRSGLVQPAAAGNSRPGVQLTVP